MRKQWRKCLAVGMAALLLTGTAGLGRVEISTIAKTYAQESEFTITNGVLTAYNGAGGEVVIPEGVSKIGDNAFKDCESLTSIQIPDGVEVIADGAFSSSSLAGIQLPDSITRIGKEAFAFCKELKEIVLPPNITHIGYGAFRQCAELENIKLPEGVQDIDSHVFLGTKWQQDRLEKDNFAVISGILVASNITQGELVIPDGVVGITEDIFDITITAKPSFTSITIPESVQWISENMYGGGLHKYSKIIKGKTGSFAQSYARKHNVAFLAEDSIFINNPELLMYLLGINGDDKIDTNEDGDISIEEMEAVKGISFICNSASNPLPSDYTELKYAKNLQELTIKDNGTQNITSLDLSMLLDLKELKSVSIYADNLTNMDGLSELSGLSSLTLICPKLEDISGVFGLTKLERLSLSCKEGMDLSGSGNLKNLNDLYLSDMGLRDISFISGLENLKSLNLQGNNIEDITVLSSLQNVTNLDLSNNNITDIKPLMDLKKLEKMALNNNPFTKAESLAAFNKQNPNTIVSCYGHMIPNEEILKFFAVDQLSTIMCGGTRNLKCTEINDNFLQGIGIYNMKDFIVTSEDESIVSIERNENTSHNGEIYVRYQLRANNEGETVVHVVCGSTAKDIRVSVKDLDETKLTPASQLPVLKTVATAWGNQFIFEYQNILWNWNQNTKRSSKIAVLTDTDKKYIARYVYNDTDRMEYAESMVLDQNNTLWNWSDISNYKKIDENVKDYDWDSIFYCKDGVQSYYEKNEVQLLKTDGRLENKVYLSELPNGVSVDDIEKVWIASPMMAILDSVHHVLYYKIPWDKKDAANTEWEKIDGIYAVFEDGTVLTDNQSLGEEVSDQNLYTAWIICSSNPKEMKYEAKLYRHESKLIIPKNSELAQENYVRFERIGEKEYLQTEDGIWYEHTKTADGNIIQKTDYIDILTSGHVLKGDHILYYNEVPVLSQVEGIKCSYHYSFWGVDKTSNVPCGVYAVRTDGAVWFHEDGFGEAEQVFALLDVEASISGGKGDINEDGRVDLSDAQTVLKAVLHIITLSEEQKSAADLDRDGNITMKDAQKILRIVLKME